MEHKHDLDNLTEQPSPEELDEIMTRVLKERKFGTALNTVSENIAGRRENFEELLRDQAGIWTEKDRNRVAPSGPRKLPTDIHFLASLLDALAEDLWKKFLLLAIRRQLHDMHSHIVRTVYRPEHIQYGILERHLVRSGFPLADRMKEFSWEPTLQAALNNLEKLEELKSSTGASETRDMITEVKNSMRAQGHIFPEELN